MTRISHRILIVEDDETTRTALARLLTLNGVEVATAASVPEAMELLVAWTPHGIVLDLWLGDTRGEVLLEWIRTAALPIKVAVMTGSGDRERLETLKPLRPDVVMLKPIRYSELLKWVDDPERSKGHAHARCPPSIAPAAHC